jgi:hypothetical protein
MDENPKIFISHDSADQALAEILREYLIRLVPAVDIFVSGADIRGGKGWFENLRSQLEASLVIIALMTRKSRTSPWVHFEAGSGFVPETTIPVCTDGVTKSDLDYPLRQLQARNLDSEDLAALFRDIAELTDRPDLSGDVVLINATEATDKAEAFCAERMASESGKASGGLHPEGQADGGDDREKGSGLALIAMAARQRLSVDAEESTFSVQALTGAGNVLLEHEESYAQLAIESTGNLRPRCNVQLLSMRPIQGGRLWQEMLDPRPLHWSAKETSAYGQHREYLDLAADSRGRRLDVAVISRSDPTHFRIVSADSGDRPAIGPGRFKLVVLVASESENPDAKRIELFLALEPRVGPIPAPLILREWRPDEDLGVPASAGSVAEPIEKPQVPPLELVLGDDGSFRHRWQETSGNEWELARVGIRNNSVRTIDDVMISLEQFEPQGFTFGPIPLRFMNQHSALEALSVHPGPAPTVFVDVIQKASSGAYQDQLVFAYANESLPNVVVARDYTLDLVLEGRDIPPARTKVTVSLTDEGRILLNRVDEG